MVICVCVSKEKGEFTVVSISPEELIPIGFPHTPR